MKQKISSWLSVIVGFAILIVVLASCKKFLDEKQDTKFTTPQSLGDMQLLLDNYGVMNSRYSVQQEVAADNYYLSTADFNALTDNSYKNYYTWQKDDERVGDWSLVYTSILYANTVLEELPRFNKLPADDIIARKLAAAAHFFRGNAFLVLAQIYAAPYDSARAAALPGIPLRLQADLATPTVRATLQQTYTQIIADFKAAALALDPLPAFVNRPSKAAAFAGLARTYLIMGNYVQAGRYADSALSIKNTLINFNTVSSTASIPFSRFNAEVIFPCITGSATPLTQSRAKVDTVLYNMYHTDDLRRTRFFRQNSNGSMAFKGDYNASNNGSTFIGYTTDELYLIKAESLARQADLVNAADALNSLMVTRWRTGAYTPVVPTTQAALLATILQERRKELCFRGLRWSDVRRLNNNPATQITMTRLLNAATFTIEPGSPRFTFQIPQRVIELTGIMQNP